MREDPVPLSSQLEKGRMPIRDFALRMALAICFVALAIFAWRIRNVLLLVFGAVLAALMLDALTEYACRFTRISRPWCLFGTTVLIMALLIGFAFLFGTQLAGEIEDIAHVLPGALSRLQEWLSAREWGQALLGHLRDAGLGGSGTEAGSFAVSTIEAAFALAANFLLILFGGLYLSAQPQLYVRGLLDLVPPARRKQTAHVGEVIATALRHWLIGQLIAMLLVGTLTGAGLLLLGIPSALALGIIAGVAEFVPIVGPILAAIPALILAIQEGTSTALYVGLLYLVIQQAESYLITPLVQRAVVHVPPVIVLFALLAFGTVLGPLGLLFATPLAVAIMVGVKALYVDEMPAAAKRSRAG